MRPNGEECKVGLPICQMAREDTCTILGCPKIWRTSRNPHGSGALMRHTIEECCELALQIGGIGVQVRAGRPFVFKGVKH